jgi:hypothetical protein
MMLASSFSTLPVRGIAGDKWQLVQDQALATFLSQGERKERLKMTLKDAASASPPLFLSDAPRCAENTPSSDALKRLDGHMLLIVVRNTGPEQAGESGLTNEMIGIVTAYDLL